MLFASVLIGPSDNFWYWFLKNSIENYSTNVSLPKGIFTDVFTRLIQILEPQRYPLQKVLKHAPDSENGADNE